MDWIMFYGGFIVGTLVGAILTMICDYLDRKHVENKTKDEKTNCN